MSPNVHQLKAQPTPPPNPDTSTQTRVRPPLLRAPLWPGYRPRPHSWTCPDSKLDLGGGTLSSLEPFLIYEMPKGLGRSP